MSLAILFHFLCAQHVSDINISIIRSTRLFCWITALVVFFLVRCVLEFRCGWVGVVSVLQAEGTCNTDTTLTQPQRNSNKHWTKNNTTNVVIQQNSRKLLMMDKLMSKTCWAHVVSVCRLKHCFSLHTDTTPPQPNHNVTPTHIEPEQNNPWNISTNKSEAPEDACINIRNMLSTCGIRMQVEALLQPAYWYHTTTAKPQRNTNTHRTRAIQPMKYLNK